MYGSRVEGVEEVRPGKQARDETEVVRGAIPGVEGRDGGPNLTKRRYLDALELASSIENYPSFDRLLATKEVRMSRGTDLEQERRFCQGRLSTIEFSRLPRGALDSHSSKEMDGLLLDGCGLLSESA